ncbi:MAG: hypothetical protein GY913_17030 [Proteobacteria bacterium]|nr:hypothetical protein [Pseudomonadota bacterium]MCP4918609.1 hypothetical protein [Pseudomonadota bacterium]
MMWLLAGLALGKTPDGGFSAFAERQAPPEEHPERAAGWDFSSELWLRVDALVDEHPGHIEPFVVGRSVEKRAIWGFRVVDPTVEAERELLVIAQLHALEWIGAEVAVAYLEEIVPTPPPGVAVTVIPIVNPDGRWRAEQDLLNDQVDTYRRANANGVDLNRDWAVHRESDVIWSRLPFSKKYYYSSPEPLSQPETQAVDAWAVDVPPDAFVSLHAFGGYVEIPWGGVYEPTPDDARLKAMASEMAEAMPNRPYRVIQLNHFVRWFRALGCEIDHFYGVHGADSFLIELTRSGIRGPATWKDYFRWYNPVDKEPHVDDGVAALLSLTRQLAGEVRGLDG